MRFTRDPFSPEELAEMPAVLRANIEKGRLLTERAIASTTHTSYQYTWQRWAKWCHTHGYDPTDYDARRVKLWVIELTTGPGEADLSPGRLRPVSLGPVLAALDRAAKAAGQSPPSHDPLVVDILRGVRRSFGMAPTRQRTALEADMLCDVVESLTSPTYHRTRDAVVVAFRGAGLSLAECSGTGINGVRWEHITFGAENATIDVPSQRGNRSRTVTLTGEDLTWLRRLQELAEDASTSGAVIDMSRPGISSCVRRCATLAGLDTDADVTIPKVRSRIHAALALPTNAQLRDLALLTVGWFSALRRSNLGLLRWSDITTVKGGIELFIRRSKTDQEGHGETIYIPTAGNSGLPCAVTALAAYAKALSKETGIDVAGTEEPVFIAVDRHDNFVRTADGSDQPALAGMTGGAIHAAISRMIESAGIRAGLYGSHSLRAGFITSAFDAGISAADIAQTSLHESLDVLMRYNRPNNRRSRSAAAQMHRASNENGWPAAEPEGASHEPPDGPPAAFMP